MDSLLANYASSDDEDQPSSMRLIPSANPVKSESRSGVERHEKSFPESTLQRAGILNSLPPPKSSIFNSVPSPKSKLFPNPKPQPEFERQREVDSDHATGNPKPKPSSSSLFSSLPLPKSSSSASAPRKVVQFRPPAIVNPVSASFNDEDEDSDQGEQQRKRKKSKESVSTTSATSFLSSIPAPRHSASLGSLPGRRSMLESDAPPSSVSAGGADSVVNTYETNYGYSGLGSESENHDYSSGNVAATDGGNVCSGSDAGMNQVHEVHDHSSGLGGENSGYYDYYGDGSMVASDVGTGGSDAGMNSNVGSYEGVDYPDFNVEHVEYTNYDVTYGDYGKNVQYENNWANNNTNPLPEVSGVAEAALRVPGRRGRKDVPPEIIEVSQDELMKNRPREDQVKSTGIAFGPAYQPAPTKGKPNKLHKRKHQIGSLYFDMRQKEMELNDRRSKGFLTKAQTQAKYGW